MICPTCRTNNDAVQDLEFCAQCGSDLHVHKLLRELNKEMQMKVRKVDWSAALKTMQPILIITCTAFIFFIGVRVLAFLNNNNHKPQFVSNAATKIDTDQLQQMSSTIKQELDLILAQHQENIALQRQVAALTEQVQQYTPLPNAMTKNEITAITE